LKDLTIVVASDDGIFVLNWGGKNRWKDPIRDEWLVALTCEDVALITLGTKFLKNEKLVQKKSFAIATGVPMEFDMVRLISVNIRALQKKGIEVTGMTPLFCFLNKSGDPCPLTTYVVDLMLGKFNSFYNMSVPIRSHDFKRGIACSALEMTSNPALISSILHHKITTIDGNTWAAAAYLVDTHAQVNAIKQLVATKAIDSFNAFERTRFFIIIHGVGKSHR